MSSGSVFRRLVSGFLADGVDDVRAGQRLADRDRVAGHPVGIAAAVIAFVMFEDDAHLTDSGFVFFRPRQEQFYLIR